MSPGRLQGCGRGIFGLINWDEARKPGVAIGPGAEVASANGNGSGKPLNRPQPDAVNHETQANETGGSTLPAEGTAIHSKFSYKANASSPLGAELSVAPGDRLTFISARDAHWWLAENTAGERGFVPASYMTVIEETKGLPWLQNRPEIPQVEPVVRKPPPSYFCQLCNKKFNGPQPYSAHMVSRAHREEEQLANEN